MKTCASKKTLLVLAAGPLQLPVITAARRLGLRVVAADGDPCALGLALADAAHVVNVTDPTVCLEVARRERVDGVIHIASEVAMAGLGLINGKLNLHGPDSDAVVRSTNKAHMRRAFEQGGAPSPKFIEVTTLAEAIEAAGTIKDKVIVKPSRNSGSRGITQLPTRYSSKEIQLAFERAMGESRDPSVVIEQCVEGPEYSVEALVWNGRIEILAVTDKFTTGAPHFVELGHSQPTQTDTATTDVVIETAVRGIRALKLDWCAAHVEIKVAPDGPYLIEVGARLGGDFITTELVPRSTGIDMVTGAIHLSLGEEPDLSAVHPPRGAAIRYCVPPAGIVGHVEGVENAQCMSGVEIVDVYIKPGDRVGAVDSSLARAGHIIAEGDTAHEAVINAENALSKLHVSLSS